MSTRDFVIGANDGLKLKARTWLVPSGTTRKAVIIFHHGYAEHRAVYDEFFPGIANAGYEVTIFDARGHGESVKTQADLGKSSDKYVFSDLDKVVEQVLTDYEGPAYLWGHSMGGGITLNYMVIGTHRERFNGYIANAPLVKLTPEMRKIAYDRWLPWVVKLIPNYVSEVLLEPALATDDESRWPSYKDDPLRLKKCSVQLIHDASARGARLLDPAFIKYIIDRPLLINQGTFDRLCDWEACERFFKMVNLTDKTLNIYKGFPHELHLTLPENIVRHRNDVLLWLDKHVSSL